MKKLKIAAVGILSGAALASAPVALVLHRVDREAQAISAQAMGSLRSPELLELVGPSRIRELLRVEDPSFFEHPGVDFGTPGQGWTTITQGVVKRFFPGPLAGVWGKSRQSLFALALDRHLTKEQQLRVFMEVAHFGTSGDREVVGFEEASRVYYGKSVQDLSRREFLGLVAMLVGPNEFNPEIRSDRHRERLARIEALLGGSCTPLSWEDVYLDGCKSYE